MEIKPRSVVGNGSLEHSYKVSNRDADFIRELQDGNDDNLRPDQTEHV